MNRRRDHDWLNDRGAIAPRARWLVLCAVMLLGACASPRDPAGEAADPPLAVAADDQTVTGLLGYAQQIAHMSNAELAKERTQLAGLTVTPSLRMRQALLDHLDAGAGAGEDLSPIVRRAVLAHRDTLAPKPASHASGA